MFFEFRQNNSGGIFIQPAINVIIEADSAEDANTRAVDFGLYFDGCSDGRDCSCCGDRWYPQWNEDGDKRPSHYGEKIDLRTGTYKKYGVLDIDWGSEEVPNFLILFKDGREKRIR